MKAKLFYSWLVALILISGCATLAVPQTFDQRLAYAYGALTAVRDTGTMLIERGRIGPEDGVHILRATDEMRFLLDAARDVYPTDPLTAENKLKFVNGVLMQLEAFLKEKEK